MGRIKTVTKTRQVPKTRQVQEYVPSSTYTFDGGSYSGGGEG